MDLKLKTDEKMHYEITIFGACTPFPRLLYWIASSYLARKERWHVIKIWALHITYFSEQYTDYPPPIYSTYNIFSVVYFPNKMSILQPWQCVIWRTTTYSISLFAYSLNIVWTNCTLYDKRLIFCPVTCLNII